MKLSILVATLIGREYYLNQMLSILKPQLITPEVELVIEIDKGELTLGGKLQKLLGRAKGDYVCCIDDDDKIPSYYVSEILKAIESKPDCVAINGIITVDGKNPEPFFHSIKYDNWFSKDYCYYRCPNQLNPVKRKLALEAGWVASEDPPDYKFSMRLRPLLKTETIIEKCMYYYLVESVPIVGKRQFKSED